MSTITINSLPVDTTRGFDVFRSSKLLKHFDTHEEARAHADAAPGRYIRYWVMKGGSNFLSFLFAWLDLDVFRLKQGIAICPIL